MRHKLQQIIDRKRYNTETATIIASNEYWDGSNKGCNATLTFKGYCEDCR